MGNPSFYLASSEGHLDATRSCWRMRSITLSGRRKALLVRVDPPIRGQAKGQPTRDLDVVALATRFREESIDSIKSWPMFVRILSVSGDVDTCVKVSLESATDIAWGEIYNDKSAADSVIARFR